jgi:hypothetical protein
MYYHFAIIMLFGPFTKVNFLGSSVSPREICLQAATAITSLVGVYRELYSLRCTPTFFPSIALASSIIHLTCLESTCSNTIIAGHSGLVEIMPFHEFAHRADQVLRIMAYNQSVAMQRVTDPQRQVGAGIVVEWGAFL